MDQNQSNVINFEMSIRFQMKDYRIAIGLKHTAVAALAAAAIKLIAWLIHTQPWR